MASWYYYLEIAGYFVLLFFIVPIEIRDKPTELERQFEQYKKDFNKTYSEDENLKRFQAFELSLVNIDLLNRNRTKHSAEYGLTKYSDLLEKEFANKHLQSDLNQRIFERAASSKSVEHDSHEDKIYNLLIVKRDVVGQGKLPSKLDWREKNVITKIKNQKSCGACWAFAAIETIESMSAINNNRLQELSVQQLIDCAGFGNKGCKGGDICNLLDWMLVSNTKVYTESEYPLTLVTGQCKIGNLSKGIQIADFSCDSLVDQEDFLLELIARNGPVAVAINAQTWQNYIGGIIQFHCDGSDSEMNHAVQIVGYDLTSVIPHYIVRNTWGTDFGDNGYLYIAIGKNICGAANEVTSIRVL